VQASMIGSIFSNLLLVLGCCFFFGGLKYKEQKFESMVATSNMGLLALSAIAMVLPTQCSAYYELEEDDSLGISRIAAVFLIIMYLQLLVFQLYTHADLFDDEGEEETEMSFSAAIGGLIGITAIITKLSEYLVASIDGFCVQSGMSRTFVGLIILPIVGNAVEHATAVSVAMKNKMDLAMGVAVGSSVQISLFVAPLTVLIGWGVGQPMSFNFPHFELILFILSVVVVSILVSNSKSNWLEGSMLITTYILIAVGFWYEKVVDYEKHDDL
jgi:Ca2+:H+ antiporter